jgi:hypothetical protein
MELFLVKVALFSTPTFILIPWRQKKGTLQCSIKWPESRLQVLVSLLTTAAAATAAAAAVPGPTFPAQLRPAPQD